MNRDELKVLWSSAIPEKDFETGDASRTLRDPSTTIAAEGTFSATDTMGSIAPRSDDTFSATDTFDGLAFTSGVARAPETNSPPRLGFGAPDCRPKPPLTSPGASSSGAYEILEELARGGMGVVYRARQASLRREVAVKQSLSQAPGPRQHFISESLVTGYLDHPNIVPVHDLEASEGQLSLAMKLVGGTEWRRILHPRNPEQEARAREHGLEQHLAILIKVCDAIAFAHSKGIAHCDLKPENVMVGDFGEVLVMDWGIAVDFFDERADSEPRARPRPKLSGPFGTPSYMAPEMAEGRGQNIDPRTDVYLLGAILHEILTKRPPNTGRTLLETLVRASEGAAPVFDAAVPRELQSICTRAMARQPGDRYASVLEFQQALRDYLGHRESLKVSDDADRSLDSCRKALDESGAESLSSKDRIRLYAGYAEAVASFRQARALWHDNPRASVGEREARIEYAEAAIVCGDLGLAEAQVDALGKNDKDKARLRGQVRARREALSRAARAAKTMRWSIASLVAIVITGLGGGSYWIYQEREAALAAEKKARDSERSAREAEKSAITAGNNEADARGEAEKARRRAEARLVSLKKAFYTMIISATDKLSNAPNRATQLALRANLTEMLAVVQDLRETAEADIEMVEFLTFEALLRLGNASMALGEYDKAREYYDQALAANREAWKHEPQNPVARRNLTRYALDASVLEYRLGKPERARELSAAALADRRALAAEKPAKLPYLDDLNEALMAHALMLVVNKDEAAAIELYTESRELSRRLLEERGDSALVNSRLGLAGFNLAMRAERAGRKAEAKASYLEALTAARKAADAEGGNSSAHGTVLFCLRALGLIAIEEGKLDRADELLAEAHERSEQSFAAGFSIMGRRTNLLNDLDRAARSFKEKGRLDLALVTYQRALRSYRAMLALDPKNPKWLQGVSKTLDQIADLQGAKKSDDPAIAALQEEIADLENQLSLDPEKPNARDNLRVAYRELARAFDKKSMSLQAGAAFDRAVEVCREIARREPKELIARRGLALAVVRAGSFRKRIKQLEAARPLLEEAERLSRQLAAEQAQNRALQTDHGYALRRLGELEQAASRFDRARESFLAALAIRAKLAAADPKDAGLQANESTACYRLAILAGLRSKHRECAEWYAKAIAAGRRAAELDPRYQQNLEVFLARHKAALQRAEAAEKTQ